jgi:hypothetical protein
MSPAEYKALQAKSKARDAEQIAQSLPSIARDNREALRLSAARDAFVELSAAVVSLAEAVEFLEHRHRANMEEINEG